MTHSHDSFRSNRELGDVSRHEMPPIALDKGRVRFVGLSRARQVSLRTVLRTVIKCKAISRAELSRKTGFSKQTTSEIVRELIADGWLREAGQTKGNIGRSAINYELDGERGFVVGVDLGGTKLSLAIANLAGSLVTETTVLTDPRGGDHVRDQLVSEVEALIESAGVSRESVFCAAIGVPGAYDRKNDVLRLTSNIADLDGKGFAASLQRRSSIPFFIENDVTVAAKGELWRGKGQTLDSFVFLAMGTGSGLGIVSEKQLVRGARGAAGEIAWLPIGGNAFDSRNFRAGTLEGAISGHAILERYRWHGGTEADTVAQIFDRMAEGDGAAAALIDEVARTLAESILAVCAIVDPQVVIMGGSIGSRVELVDRIRALLPLCMRNPVPVEISPLGPRAALLGALGMALDRVHETLFQQ